MSDLITVVDDSNFEVEVLSSNVPVLVDMGASWCSPCRSQLPILEKFAIEHAGKIKVVKVDIDDAPAITSKLSVRSVPTLMVFNEGKLLTSKVGLTTLAQLNDLVLTKIG